MSDAKSQAGNEEVDTPAQADERGIDRRDFLRASAVLGACFADPRALRAALAQARALGKPVLTQKTLNEFLAKAHDLDAATKKQMAAEAKANLSAFLSKHFATTDAQKQVLGGYTTRDHAVLSSAIDTAVNKNASITVTISHPVPPKATSRPQRRIPRGRGAATSIKSGGGTAGWKREWLQDKLEREGRASPGDKVEVGDGVLTIEKSMKAYAKSSVSFKGNEAAYGGEVGIEASC
ncbi:MAG TPA: twin-arginine translocation signal domain-containing protein [Gemmatimonadaceae bacterium]|jgi:hypothetical protein